MKKLIMPVICLALCLMLLVTAAYAWFTNRMALNNFIIITGNIDLEVEKFCRLSDFDYDGITDVDEDGDDIYIDIDYSAGSLLSLHGFTV